MNTENPKTIGNNIREVGIDIKRISEQIKKIFEEINELKEMIKPKEKLEEREPYDCDNHCFLKGSNKCEYCDLVWTRR